MIYTIISFLTTIIYSFGSDTTSKVTFGVTFLLNIGISLIMLPINIRLAGQLVMQVFKYRYICNHVATLDEDNKVMTGYYNHFRSVMCIIICMVGFNVFNIISAVLFLIKFYKWEWGEVWWYWWVAEGLCSAFEESVILYAVVMLYQIACYFQGKKLRVLIMTIVIVFRFIYTSILTGFVLNYMVVTTEIPFPWMITTQRSILGTLELISAMMILEFSLRFPMLFSFVRSTQRVVSKYINEFLNDMNTNDLDRQHFVDKVLAGKLFQIAGWGTISVSFMTSFVYVLQYFMMISFSYLVKNGGSATFITVLRTLAVTLFTIIQVFTILPSILYCIFLIMLWLYFRDRTKVKYSGYSSNDPKILKLIHKPNHNELTNQDEFHYTYYKRKYTVMNTTYVLCIVVISALFAGFFAPILDKKWTWDITLRPGDYHLLGGSILKSDCYNNQFEIRVEQNSLDSHVDLHCNECILVGEILQSHTNYVTTTYDNSFRELWLPKNSVYIQQKNGTVYNHTYSIPSILVKSHFPCYYPQFEPYFYYFDHTFSKELVQYSCKGAEVIKNSDRHIYQPYCDNDTRKTGELECTIRFNGLYFINLYAANHYQPDYLTNITVKKFGYAINESNSIPLNLLEGEQLHKYDVIVFNSTINMNDFCSIHATCRFNLAFRILMPFVILLSSMFLLTTCLILIHKI